MSTKKSNRRESAEKPAEKAKIVDAQELADDELEEVSGGFVPYSSSDDGGGCITA